MTAHRITQDLFRAEAIVADPGNAGSIYTDKSPSICNLVSAGAETRTLARPTRAGVLLTLYMRTYIGTVTVTVTGNTDVNSDATFALSAADQYVTFLSFYTGSVYEWRIITHYGLANLTPAITAALLAAGATSVATPAAGVAAGYKIARGVHTQLAASDTVITGLATVVAVVAQFSSNPTVKQFMCAASIGDQAGTPAAGSFLLKTFKPTNNTNDSTPVAATDFTDNLGIAWIAIGT